LIEYFWIWGYLVVDCRWLILDCGLLHGDGKEKLVPLQQREIVDG